ncbi:hypothetical protein SAMD00023353_1202120 [Rosellinia necatrix]|uniref:Uncharacterized protein n=1 Tax=Rosellinia necatrix TaxID=77044 RepID=A0A1W2TKI5_ROSNE|nr:hypothetical protein SAMD00023353_1202120 [Rosellinia necatrix]
MRSSSLISVLAVAAVHSLPITPFNDSILDNLQDLIYKSVGNLFNYPFGAYGYGGPGCYSCNFDSKFCVSQCLGNCVGGADECSNCLSSCWRDSGCFGGNRNGNGADPKQSPQGSEEPKSEPTPAQPAP